MIFFEKLFYFLNSAMASDISLFPSFVTTLTLIFVYVLTFLFNEIIRKKLGISQYRATLIFFWHNFFTIVYLIYSYALITDAKVYFLRALSQEVQFKFGSLGIDYTIFILREYLHLSYFGIFVFFGFFGCIGLLIFDASISYLTQFSKKSVQQWSSFIVFLPSLSFWTSAIGKDSLAFLSISIAVWAALKLNQRIKYFYLSFAIIFFVRPHISVIYIFSFLLFQLFNRNTYKSKLFFLFLFNIFIMINLFPIGLKYAGVMNVDNIYN